MNGILNITGRIEADAEKTANTIRARAEREAENIRESFAELAKEEAASILKKGERLAAERAQRLGGVAQLEARKMSLRAKQQMIDLAFKNALSDLRGLTGDAYIKVLAQLAKEASVSGKEQIILSEEDHKTIGAAVVKAANQEISGGALTLSDETRKIKGGLILKEDTLEVDASFGTIVRLMRDELAGDVANILFS